MRLEDLEKMLFITKTRLDDELEIHPELQWRISKEWALANAEVQRCKDMRDEREAVLQQASDLSVAKTQASIQRDERWIKLNKAYQEAKHTAELWMGMHSAWVSRGFALKSLCDLHGHDYFASDSHTVSNKPAGVSSARRLLMEDRQARQRAPEQPAAPVRRRVLTD